MSSGDVTRVSERLVALKKSIPDCFARKPRGLQEIERWKATEFRQFALYTGKIVLKGALQGHLYEHFLCFSTALCILVNPDLTKSQGLYADQLLKYFVEKGRELYGETFLVYNVHSLLHLSEDAQNFGCLDNCSAFKFESYLHQMKKMVRSGKNVLTQVANRLEETSRLKISNKEKVVSLKCPNNTFVLSPEECCEVVSEEVNNTVLCRVFTNLQPYLMTPCDSRLYGTYVASTRHSQMRCIGKEALDRMAFMDYLRYVVLHFMEYNEVEVAPSGWLEWENERKTSSFPSAEGQKRRKVNENSESSEGECTDEAEELVPKRKKQPCLMLPTAPSFPPTQPSSTNHQVQVPSTSTFLPQQHRSSSTTQQVQEMSKLFEGLERRICLKLEQIHADIKTALGTIQQSVSRPGASASDLTEVLKEPCRTVAELEDLCDQLKDADFRKKTIRYLCLQSGASLGDGIRRMLRKIGHNALWANYSYKGRKEKRPFQPLLINDVIIRACSKVYPQHKSQSVEDMIAVTLKHAPHRGITKTNNQVLLTSPKGPERPLSCERPLKVPNVPCRSCERSLQRPPNVPGDVPLTFKEPYTVTSRGRSGDLFC
ncbi:transposase domain-containing protein [Triplophysa rosa]|uniref:Transposase domain-containing protein n=1 Tax=Triplophysa rosa TaxID=992332 RepID=A0A9W7WFB3_TRIRA|nr:transposase domain-containing protein [Triplophysa rosa]